MQLYDIPKFNHHDTLLLRIQRGQNSPKMTPGILNNYQINNNFSHDNSNSQINYAQNKSFSLQNIVNKGQRPVIQHSLPSLSSGRQEVKPLNLISNMKRRQIQIPLYHFPQIKSNKDKNVQTGSSAINHKASSARSTNVQGVSIQDYLSWLRNKSSSLEIEKDEKQEQGLNGKAGSLDLSMRKQTNTKSSISLLQKRYKEIKQETQCMKSAVQLKQKKVNGAQNTGKGAQRHAIHRQANNMVTDKFNDQDVNSPRRAKSIDGSTSSLQKRVKVIDAKKEDFFGRIQVKDTNNRIPPQSLMYDKTILPNHQASDSNQTMALDVNLISNNTNTSKKSIQNLLCTNSQITFPADKFISKKSRYDLMDTSSIGPDVNETKTAINHKKYANQYKIYNNNYDTKYESSKTQKNSIVITCSTNIHSNSKLQDCLKYNYNSHDNRNIHQKTNEEKKRQSLLKVSDLKHSVPIVNFAPELQSERARVQLTDDANQSSLSQIQKTDPVDNSTMRQPIQENRPGYLPGLGTINIQRDAPPGSLSSDVLIKGKQIFHKNNNAISQFKEHDKYKQPLPQINHLNGTTSDQGVHTDRSIYRDSDIVTQTLKELLCSLYQNQNLFIQKFENPSKRFHFFKNNLFKKNQLTLTFINSELQELIVYPTQYEFEKTLVQNSLQFELKPMAKDKEQYEKAMLFDLQQFNMKIEEMNLRKEEDEMELMASKIRKERNEIVHLEKQLLYNNKMNIEKQNPVEGFMFDIMHDHAPADEIPNLELSLGPFGKVSNRNRVINRKLERVLYSIKTNKGMSPFGI